MVFCCVFGENVSFFEIFASRVTLIQQIPLGQRFCPLKNGPCKRDDLTSEIFYEATTRKWDQAKTTLASASVDHTSDIYCTQIPTLARHRRRHATSDPRFLRECRKIH